ncbi:MAG: glycosyltransferase family 2 protein [Bacteriovorax sp.]
MKNVAQVTLCIPVYNAEKTILRTLESLVNQDYPIYKIKIFDNVSTDRSIEICQDFAQKFSFIELFTNEKNLGAEGNFTKCILAAEGDYCALVHSDDVYESDFISKSVAVLESCDDCIATFSGALEIDAEENVVGERFLPKELRKEAVTLLSQEDLLALIFKYSNFITCPSVVVRANAYSEKIKSWNGGGYKSSADLDVWLRLSEMGKIAAIRTPLLKYRVAEASFSYRIAKKRTTKHDLFLVLNEYKNKNKLTPSMIEDYYFLELKDQSLRSLNIIRNKKRDERFPREVKFNLLLVLKKMFHSKWHFKFGLGIIAINALAFTLGLMGWNQKCKK